MVARQLSLFTHLLLGLASYMGLCCDQLCDVATRPILLVGNYSVLRKVEAIKLFAVFEPADLQKGEFSLGSSKPEGQLAQLPLVVPLVGLVNTTHSKVAP